MTKFLHFNNHEYNLSKASQRIKKLFQSRTVAAEPVVGGHVRALATDFINDHSPTVDLKVGVTTLHPNDRYCKKTGREQAILNMETVTLTVVGLVSTPTHVFLRLEDYKGVALNLRLNKKTGFSTITGSQVKDRPQSVD